MSSPRHVPCCRPPQDGGEGCLGQAGARDLGHRPHCTGLRLARNGETCCTGKLEGFVRKCIEHEGGGTASPPLWLPTHLATCAGKGVQREPGAGREQESLSHTRCSVVTQAARQPRKPAATRRCRSGRARAAGPWARTRCNGGEDGACSGGGSGLALDGRTRPGSGRGC